jgi:hypothetical protein
MLQGEDYRVQAQYPALADRLRLSALPTRLKLKYSFYDTRPTRPHLFHDNIVEHDWT